MANSGKQIVQDNAEASAYLGIAFLCITTAYCAFIIIADSRKHKKVSISQNLPSSILDGITLATGVIIISSIFYPKLFLVIATNFVYATVTGLSCVVVPVISLAKRYNRLVE